MIIPENYVEFVKNSLRVTNSKAIQYANETIISEVGEIFDLKKKYTAGQATYAEIRDDLLFEIGDILWALTVLFSYHQQSTDQDFEVPQFIIRQYWKFVNPTRTEDDIMSHISNFSMQILGFQTLRLSYSLNYSQLLEMTALVYTMCKLCDVSIESVMQMNMNKITKRQRNKERQFKDD